MTASVVNRIKMSPKETAFVAAYFECNRNGSEAYRRVYANHRSPNVRATELMKRPSVRAAVEARENELRSKSDLNLEEALQILTGIARESERAGDAIKAVETWAKLTGAGAGDKKAHDRELAQRWTDAMTSVIFPHFLRLGATSDQIETIGAQISLKLEQIT